MKTTPLTILVSITLALVCVLLVLNFLGDNTSLPSNSSQIADSEDTIKVYGQGKVSLRPDVAYITLGIENIEMNPKKAHDNNAEQMDKIINALKEAGVAPKDIQTSRYNINQEYDHNNGTRQLRGYRVTNTIIIVVRDIDKCSNIIDIAFSSGSNVFQGIEFNILDRHDAYMKAMDLAIERAEQKAKAFALKCGKSIVGIKEITEDKLSYSSYYNPQGNLMAYQALSMARDRHTDNISTGELQVVAKINVVYELGN